jgi:hypothetical protein
MPRGLGLYPKCGSLGPKLVKPPFLGRTSPSARLRRQAEGDPPWHCPMMLMACTSYPDIGVAWALFAGN